MRLTLKNLVWLTAFIAVITLSHCFSFLSFDKQVLLLSVDPARGASAANSSAAADATALALFSAGAAGLGYYLLRRGRGGSVLFAPQQNFSALSLIKSSISSAVEGIKNFLVKNSDAIKTGSDIAGWVSLGLFVAGAILSLTGVGAVVGVPLMTVAFAVGAGSAAADLAVGAARQSAGVADADDYIRMGLAPLAIIPIGRVAAQPGKMVVKQAGRQIAKNIVRDAKGFKPAAKNLLPKFTRKELDEYERWANRLYHQYGGKGSIKVVSKSEGIDRCAHIGPLKNGRGYKITLNRKYSGYIKPQWNSFILHEVDHANLTLPKFQQKFLPNAAARGEIEILLNDARLDKLEEAVVDIISAYQSARYGKAILRWGREIGKESAGIRTVKPGMVTKKAIKWARDEGLRGLERDLKNIEQSAAQKGRMLPAVVPLLPSPISQQNSISKKNDRFDQRLGVDSKTTNAAKRHVSNFSCKEISSRDRRGGKYEGER